jgi:hypothetical protein
MLTAHLRDMFDGEIPTVVSDSAVSAEWAATVGLPFSYVSELTGPLLAALIILTRDENYTGQRALSETFTGSRSLWLPLAAFDGADEAVSYGLRHLTEMDFATMIRGHQAALEHLEQTNLMSFRGSRGTDVEVSFGPEVEFTMLADLKVPIGDPSPLASFFEFETEIEEEQFAAGQSRPFSANGTLRPSGILCAHAPGAYSAADTAVRQGRELARRAAVVDTTVTISDGAVACIKMENKDVTDEFARLAGIHGQQLSEFAIGFYHAADGSLDWRINSPINEGVRGIHFGIGDGSSGMHFDFVCDDVASE